MILSPKYRKIFNKIRKSATESIELCKKSEECHSGIKYLEDHFLFDLPVYRNLSIVKYLAESLPKGSKVLDWGCGYGDVSYMLKTLRSDLDIQLFDVLTSVPWDILSNKEGLRKIIGTDEIKLPFEDGKFDAVVGVGVLEHVKNQNASLAEIYRIIKQGGRLYVFFYPNKFSYTEKFQKIIHHPHHDKPLCMEQLEDLLKVNGFNVEISKHELIMPFVLSRFPIVVRHAYNFAGNVIVILNDLLEKIPILNKFCSNLTIIAQKK